MKKTIKHLSSSIAVVLLLFIAFGSDDSSKNTKTKTKSNTEKKNNSSEETSRKVYRQGYSDGQTSYGLPASSRATALEFYMSRGYNFSGPDYYVYEMGYKDGAYGRHKQY